ncbi:MAG: VCBS repeat-containing protein, partial [Pirellulales bacterium]|nr:VCBS repeat-containing protein [Pirellulales bacterium]
MTYRPATPSAYLRAVVLLIAWSILCLSSRAQWKRHTIDASSKGADGVRLGDVNHDGLPDVVTPWEQGGVIRVYLNPGAKHAKKHWPAVTVGKVGGPEDAVFADLDGDGMLDVVSSCEGRTRSVFVHWSPRDMNDILDASAWTTEA